MNKQDKIIVAILVAILVGWFVFQSKQPKPQQQVSEVTPASAETQAQQDATTTSAPAVAQTVAPLAATLPESVLTKTDVEEKTFELKNEDFAVTISSKGATIAKTILFGYKKENTKDSEDIVLENKTHRALALENIPNLDAGVDFEASDQTDTSITLKATTPSGLAFTRKISLQDNYQISVIDDFANTTDAQIILPENAISFGEVGAIESTPFFAVDALGSSNGKGGLPDVDHWEKKGRVAQILTGRTSGGCTGGGVSNGEMLPLYKTAQIYESQLWVAIKSRFFTQAMVSKTANIGYRIGAMRQNVAGPLKLEAVDGAILFPAIYLQAGTSQTRDFTMYIGPKKYSVLRKLGEKTQEIMDFGTWKWLCMALLPLLNFLNGIFHNYGIAIILLTIIVRLIFWPLTHKSNESMKKMQEIQPIIKELQTKFKDNPQKLQMETMEVYRKYKINPMASCLPMLIQIPVFIALFVVLRSAVELRFAPFLWIADLSEPENLFYGKLPFVRGLNILPILMAVTMFYQSKLTPTAGDPSQQKMMMWLMPAMMLFMFYSMPSALVLYWSVSQILAIIQLYRQRCGITKKQDEIVIEEPNTRQARRRAERGE